MIRKHLSQLIDPEHHSVIILTFQCTVLSGVQLVCTMLNILVTSCKPPVLQSTTSLWHDQTNSDQTAEVVHTFQQRRNLNPLSLCVI